jgi:hypothetical protein
MTQEARRTSDERERLREALDEIEAAIEVWKRPKVGTTSGRGHALAVDGDAAMAMSMVNAAMVKLLE